MFMVHLQAMMNSLFSCCKNVCFLPGIISPQRWASTCWTCCFCMHSVLGMCPFSFSLEQTWKSLWGPMNKFAFLTGVIFTVAGCVCRYLCCICMCFCQGSPLECEICPLLRSDPFEMKMPPSIVIPLKDCVYFYLCVPQNTLGCAV